MKAENIKYEVNNENPWKRKQFIRTMFDSIVPTYDLLNHVLSFGTDVIWRRDLAKKTGAGENELVVDLCCGTGDVSSLLTKRKIKTVSLDFSLEMLQRGVKKGALVDSLVMGDACVLPFPNDTFDAATIAFGIRNIPDLDRFMIETHRVLKPGGSLIILELVRPENRAIAFLYSIYLGKVLPVIGGILSRRPQAYRYLSQTISTFVRPQELKDMLKSHGFTSLQQFTKTLGVAAIIVCRKESV